MNSSEELIADNYALLRHFDLSQNKFLRTLEITAESINAGDTACDFLKTVLSSVTPGPLDAVIIYRDFSFIHFPHCMGCNQESAYFRHYTQGIRVTYARYHQRQLKVFREMHSVRDFRLALCADISDGAVKHIVETLECIAKAERVKEGIDNLLYKPLVILERRMLRTRLNDYNAGFSGRWVILASAL